MAMPLLKQFGVCVEEKAPVGYIHPEMDCLPFTLGVVLDQIAEIVIYIPAAPFFPWKGCL
jgi:hypothetical protein